MRIGSEGMEEEMVEQRGRNREGNMTERIGWRGRRIDWGIENG